MAVAKKSNLKVTDEHFEMASETKTGDWLGTTGDKLGMQPPATATQGKQGMTLKPEENVTFAEIAGHLEMTLVAEEGFEPPTRGL